MGASTVAGAIFTGPIDKQAGKGYMAVGQAIVSCGLPTFTNLNGYQPETELRAGPSL
jgi:hypothetical protein